MTGPEIDGGQAVDLARLTDQREVFATCYGCGRTFSDVPPAAAHSRAERHRVWVHLLDVFTIVPGDDLGGGPR
jgi:hypothetical protein